MKEKGEIPKRSYIRKNKIEIPRKGGFGGEASSQERARCRRGQDRGSSGNGWPYVDERSQLLDMREGVETAGGSQVKFRKISGNEKSEEVAW